MHLPNIIGYKQILSSSPYTCIRPDTYCTLWSLQRSEDFQQIQGNQGLHLDLGARATLPVYDHRTGEEAGQNTGVLGEAWNGSGRGGFWREEAHPLPLAAKAQGRQRQAGSAQFREPCAQEAKETPVGCPCPRGAAAVTAGTPKPGERKAPPPPYFVLPRREAPLSKTPHHRTAHQRLRGTPYLPAEGNRYGTHRESKPAEGPTQAKGFQDNVRRAPCRPRHH